jgi:PAS domain S-box-containing protein
LDRNGVVRWANEAAIRIGGPIVGRSFTAVVAPEDVNVARDQFARKILGSAASTDFEVSIIDADGRRLKLELSSVALRDEERVVGVFGLARPARTVRPQRPSADSGPPVRLTPRQHEALSLLGAGLGTRDIAVRLGVTEETARNHIRLLLRELGVHTRLEAVVVGQRRGLI